MLFGKDLTGNPVIAVNTGEVIGKVKDVYTDHSLSTIAGLYLGVKGILDRTPQSIRRENIVTMGPDAVLVDTPEALHEGQDFIDEGWVRRDDIQGRQVTTNGSTPVGRIDDIMLENDGVIEGFSMNFVYVDGPVREKQAVDRNTVIDLGHENGIVTVDLAAVEQQELQVA